MTRRRWALALAVGVLVVAVGVFALTGRGSTESVLLRPGDAGFVAIGERIYAEHCASCHGANLEGETPDWRAPGPDSRLPAPPHDETGHTWHHDDVTLFRLTKYGLAAMLGPDATYESNMPAYEGVLSDDEILAVLSFIKSRWPAELRARHDAMSEQAAER